MYFFSPGYNNTEKVCLSSLLDSEGLQSQIAQHKESTASEQCSSSMEFDDSHKTNGFQSQQMDCETNEPKSLKNMYTAGPSNFNIGAIPPAPPLPPQLMAK